MERTFTLNMVPEFIVAPLSHENGAPVDHLTSRAQTAFSCVTWYFHGIFTT